MNDRLWRKSSRSNGVNNCVEVRADGWLRDSKQAASPLLRVDIAGLVAAIRADAVRDR